MKRKGKPVKKHELLTMAASTVAAAIAMSGCTAGGATTSTGSSSASVSGVTTVTNCNQKVTFPSPANRVFVNDGGMVAMMLSIGAEKNLVGVSSLGPKNQSSRNVLAAHYGTSTVSGLDNIADTMPSLETIVGTEPQVVVAGWNYGFKEGAVTPDQLTATRIDPYILSESCRQEQGEKARGIMDPWTALDTDISNLGVVTGHENEASKEVADIDSRRQTLERAPQATTRPSVLVFDSGDQTVFTSGKFGGPQAVITAAGGNNVMADVSDTWTTVSWERVASSNPDVIVFVDYGTQTFAQKVALLESNPSTRDLPAVKNRRFLNLPYAMWVSSPLNIDAAEQLRYQLEQWSLVPSSTLGKPTHDDHVEVSPNS